MTKILILFGNSCLSDANGKIILLKNIIELAILVYLSRQEGRIASRKKLAEIIWDDVDAKRQLVSLRQAMKNLRLVEKSLGFQFVEADNLVVRLKENALKTDIEEIHDALSNGSRHSISKAQRLLAPSFMTGFEKLGNAFQRWRQEEQKIVLSRLLEHAAAQLYRLADARDPTFAALARFILKIEPAYEWAHQRLIQHYVASGAEMRAKHQFEDCADLLNEVFGTSPRLETTLLLGDDGRAAAISDIPPSVHFCPPPMARADLFPVINIGVGKVGAQFKSNASILIEFAEQIGKNREFVIRGKPGAGAGKNSGSGAIGLDDASGGQFTLDVTELRNGAGAVVQLRSRSKDQSVFYDVLPINNTTPYEDRLALIGRSVVSMQNDMRKYYRSNLITNGGMYGKLSKVYDLVRKFDQKAISQGFGLLNEVTNESGPSSLVYAFRASLSLQKNLFLNDPNEFRSLFSEARQMASSAVELDPWHALSYRYLAFATCFSEEQEEGLKHMLRGHSLAPLDPLQTIATAEVCAFADDIDSALKFSDEAFRYKDELPRYAYGYLANIQFAAGNYEEAARLAQQAPPESMDYRATRISALWELGRKNEAAREMRMVINKLAGQTGMVSSSNIEAVCQWLGDLTPFRNEQVRALYRRGIHEAAV